ncbi:hypothetical protein Acsp03_07510 [Actinomadura sp. NBRC 104412]|uniref:DUF3040 domain-containing protein n=1 Tax=Actinomadura sp. NBRC 104412 TaxID=3032203 RepID=UPI0024A4D798|nr:DUF3040 domain-containing protein [Actinomadura sp. NBRC 104412]GLZ03284.1 hypothetical protein Acsp03_07510 [Actinomadura sp. NBRC 104412]
MALSMEERRILAQIEIHLSEDDPRLAHRLEKFGRTATRARDARPRPRRRVKIIAAAVVVTAAAAGIATAVLSAFS